MKLRKAAHTVYKTKISYSRLDNPIPKEKEETGQEKNEFGSTSPAKARGSRFMNTYKVNNPLLNLKLSLASK